MRILVVVLMSLFLLVGPSVAQPVEAPWQSVVSGQIEAFRAGDGETALGFAGASFRNAYQNPERFLVDIDRAGYAPLTQSRSHSFGEYRILEDETVVQIVLIVGPELRLYEAIYQLGMEDDGSWRVRGVVMRKQDGIGT